MTIDSKAWESWHDDVEPDTLRSGDAAVREVRAQAIVDRADKGRKDDKPKWNLLPWRAMCHVVDVLTYGATKHGADNWQHVPDHRERYFSAAMRHMVAWRTGEQLDPETGYPHLAHAATNVLFLLAREGDEE